MPMFDFQSTFGFSLDWTFWSQFIFSSPWEQFVVILAIGGWVFLASFFMHAGVEQWTLYRQNKFTAKWQWVLLAVDVPPLFIQTPKAVEQIFAHISGSFGNLNVMDKFWTGKKQKYFSFEIISIEGYIQFLVRTEVEFRDLIEASIYAQYPEAEITEVEDYVGGVPDKYPSPDYEVMGVEFKLAEKDAYPIRTYPDFAYMLSKDAVFSDPMAAFLENFTRISHGENLWMQIIIEPTDSKWKEEGISLVKKLLGQASAGSHGLGLGAVFTALPKEMLKYLAWAFNSAGEEPKKADKKDKADLEPGAREAVALIEAKISKVGFKSKLRVLYAARPEVFAPNRCLAGFIGAMNQFRIQSSNTLAPYMSTAPAYDKNKNKSNKFKRTFVKAFKKRGIKWKKCGGYILNIEELATVWHFPLPFVKTPLLQKSGYKRGEPPSGLPVEFSETPLKRIGAKRVEEAIPEPIPEPPAELPYA